MHEALGAYNSPLKISGYSHEGDAPCARCRLEYPQNVSSEAAAELGRKRWEDVPKEERAEYARMMNAAKFAGLTKKEISEKARAAAHAR
jgi:hypothetical protein